MLPLSCSTCLQSSQWIWFVFHVWKDPSRLSQEHERSHWDTWGYIVNTDEPVHKQHFNTRLCLLCGCWNRHWSLYWKASMNCCLIWTESGHQSMVCYWKGIKQKEKVFSQFLWFIPKLQAESSGTLQFCQHFIWKGEAEQLQNNLQAAILHIYRGRKQKTKLKPQFIECITNFFVSLWLTIISSHKLCGRIIYLIQLTSPHRLPVLHILPSKIRSTGTFTCSALICSSVWW